MQGFVASHGAVKVGPADPSFYNNNTATTAANAMKSPRAQKRNSINVRLPGLIHRDRGMSMSSLNPAKFDDIMAADFASGFEESAICLSEITSKAATILEAQTCQVWMIDETNHQLYALVQDNGGSGEELRLTKPLDRGITASVVSEPGGFNTQNVSTSGRFSHDIDEIDLNKTGKTTSYLAWPLLDGTGGQCIGVVEFRNKHDGEASFNAADSQLARIVSIQLANAIVLVRQNELIAGRNEAINKAYEEKSYDAAETICIDSRNEDGSNDNSSFETKSSSSSAMVLQQQQQQQQHQHHQHLRQRSAFALAPGSSCSPTRDNTGGSALNRQGKELGLDERGWDYDTFLHTEEELIAHAIDIFDERGLLARYSIPVSVFTNFLREIIAGYRIEAPYHNHYHCFDVLHVCYLLITRCKADEYLESFNVLSIFIAALAHDLGHDGYNNAFHAATESEAAITYNGVSILENNSAAQLFRILKKEECNILARISGAEATKMRSRLIDLILDTDAKNHFMLCTRFKHGMEMKQLSRGLLSSMLLHIADVSNPSRPGSIARKWAFVVQEEFFRQGDKEKELNLPRSPFMDREYENLPRMQGAFIDAIVTPVFKLLSDFLPSVKEQCIKSLQLNRAFWKNMESQGMLKSSDITALLDNHQNRDLTFDACVEDSSSDENDDSDDDDEDDNDAIQLDTPIPGIPANALHAMPSGNARRVSLISLHSPGSRHLNGIDPELGKGGSGQFGKGPMDKKRKRKSWNEQKAFCFHSVKAKLTTLLESQAFQLTMMLATIYALFASDLSLALGNKNSDEAVDVISFFVLLMFLGEMCASILCIPRYMQFYFWLDLAATISLVLEIDFLLELGSSSTGSPDQLSLAKASRAAKVGARAARLSRLLRLVRLIRVAKVVKWMMGFIRRKHDTRQKGYAEDAEEVEMKISVVGQRMTESITKKVIIAVMLTLLVFSLMDVSLVPDGRQIQLDGLALAVESNDDGASASILREALLESHNNIIMLRGTGDGDEDIIHFQERINSLRPKEMLTIQASTNSSIMATFDLSKETEIAAWYSFGTTLIVTILLAALSLSFSRDAYRIMIRPIEHMKDTVTQLSQNPLLHLEKMKKKGKETATETDMLEVAINKMGTLLQIGFGTAGAEIIAKSLSEGGELDPMIPGSRVNAIFGFCDIRDFTFATEGLQQDVMLFVNKIAAITHRHVVDSGGAPNKNIGDAFLLVWKLASSKDGGRSRLQKELFDGALLCVQRIISEINKLGNLSNFLDGETDENAAWKSTLEDFQVAMGFGLHTGWAIEGSIGSKVKIDASYLSPNVNLASRLETATKQYRVPLLMSEAFVSNLTGSIQKCCRKVDKVTFKGSSEPMTIYHYDNRPYDALATTTKPSNYDELTQATSWKDGTEIRHSGVDITEVTRAFDSGKSLDVREVYEDLFNAYLDGKWSRCKILCRLWMEQFPGDVLVHNIIEYLMKYSFQCPKTWAGYHPLSEK